MKVNFNVKKTTRERHSIKNNLNNTIETKEWTETNTYSKPFNPLYVVLPLGIALLTFILYKIFSLIFHRKNWRLKDQLRTNRIANLQEELVKKDTNHSTVVMNNCLINGENCLTVFPLLDENLIFSDEDDFDKLQVDDQFSFRRKYFEQMLLHSKEKKRLRYIPYRNVQEKRPIKLNTFSILYRKLPGNRRRPLSNALRFITDVLCHSNFFLNADTFFFCVLSATSIEVTRYNFLGNEFVKEKPLYFYFDESLARECFCYIVEIFSEKFNEKEIEHMLDTMENEEPKTKMCLKNN